jgi:pyruvate/2-oxoglutarate/acetoin dehydrogenase E1 component
MIRDNGPCFLFAPVNMMKDSNGTVDLSKCLPLNKAALVHKASGKAVTVLTYLHGVKESLAALDSIKEGGFDIDLIKLRSLKPLDMDTIRQSLYRTNRLCILDESTKTGRVGATISARVSEELFSLLDAPVKHLCMDDAPAPYVSSMERAVVKRGSDLIEGERDLCNGKWACPVAIDASFFSAKNMTFMLSQILCDAT